MKWSKIQHWCQHCRQCPKTIKEQKNTRGFHGCKKEVSRLCHRGEGIGKLLHKDLAGICKKWKIREIMLDVFERNENARKFYEKEGFEEFVHILIEKLN